ncbi:MULTISPECIES: hypothetical protein [unclassified Leucobacter]|uniref:hypothetical protein n=1 Tax=unclassified Leucobacter TaxID=2621730 RepID=UPI00165E1758|nr:MULTISPECIES: hypothetical protein [unclassified Leucobacter]MBC9936565.1 hypothetical protein [Leucobacter sp. cx-87]
MAEGKNLKATGDAADVVRGIRTSNHGAPSQSEMTQVSGVKVGPAEGYTSFLSKMGSRLEVEFQNLLKVVLTDCERSEQSIEQMQALDEEIAGVLNQMSVDTGAAGNPSGGGSKATSW